jgi:hypothetical protein
LYHGYGKTGHASLGHLNPVGYLIPDGYRNRKSPTDAQRDSVVQLLSTLF